MRISFVIEAGKGIGLGHFMRTRNLARAARAARCDVSVCLIGADVPKKVDFAAAKRVARVGGPTEVEDAFARMGSRPDWVVLDGYGLTELRPTGRSLVIDDFADRPITADLVVNQNSERAELYARPGFDVGRVLAGPHFSLVDPVFQRARRSVKTRLKRVLVSLGGGDGGERTEIALTALGRMPGPLAIDVVIGPFFRHDSQLPSRLGAHTLTYHRGILGLAPLMAKADLVMCPASVTAWEACCAAKPIIVFQTSEKQALLLETLVAHGAARVATEASLDDILRDLEQPDSRKALSLAAGRLVDGGGPARVLEAITHATGSR